MGDALRDEPAISTKRSSNIIRGLCRGNCNDSGVSNPGYLRIWQWLGQQQLS